MEALSSWQPAATACQRWKSRRQNLTKQNRFLEKILTPYQLASKTGVKQWKGRWCSLLVSQQYLICQIRYIKKTNSETVTLSTLVGSFSSRGLNISNISNWRKIRRWKVCWCGDRSWAQRNVSLMARISRIPDQLLICHRQPPMITNDYQLPARTISQIGQLIASQANLLICSHPAITTTSYQVEHDYNHNF